MKKFLVAIVIIIILGIIYLYYNYQQTTFIYKNNIPQWFFDDIWRIIVQNDQYEVFKDFMSWTYSIFLSWIETNQFSEISKWFDQAIASGDKQYFIENKQTIIDLERTYQENKIFDNLNNILLTWSRWHLNPNNDIVKILDDIPIRLRKIINQISWMLILRCNLEPNQELCNQYQSIIKEIMEKSDRRSWLIQWLINLTNTKYIVQQEKISWINLNLCLERSNWNEKYKKDMTDEYNISFKTLIKWVINPLREDLNTWQLEKGLVPKFILSKSNKQLLPDELETQSNKKWQEMFYTLISWKDNIQKKKLSKIPVTKLFLAFIGIKTDYLIWDVISNILLDTLVWKLQNISIKYKELWDICKENSTF